MLGLIAVVTGSADHAAEQKKPGRSDLLLLRSLLRTRLGFRRLLGSFLGRHFQRLLSPWIQMPFLGKIGYASLRHPTRETTAQSKVTHTLSTTHAHLEPLSCARSCNVAYIEICRHRQAQRLAFKSFDGIAVVVK